MPRLLELFCGTKSVGRAFEAAGWEVVSLDIVSKFEPTILCDIRSWDYTTFPPGHFDHLQQIASNTCAQLGSKRSNWQATRAILSPTLLQRAWYCIRTLWHREECLGETAVDQRRQLLLVLYPLQAFPA